MDTNISNKTEKYIYLYFTTLLVVLIGFIGDLYWVSDKVKHDFKHSNSGKHGAVQNTCIYTRKNMINLRKKFFKHTLHSDTYN